MADMKLTFQRIKELPGASQIKAMTNPFQAEVNDIAKTGEASCVICTEKSAPNVDGMFDEETARRLIRGAVQNIDKGCDTKVAPVLDDKGQPVPGRVFVYFKVRAKRPKQSNANTSKQSK